MHLTGLTVYCQFVMKESWPTLKHNFGVNPIGLDESIKISDTSLTFKEIHCRLLLSAARSERM